MCVGGLIAQLSGPMEAQERGALDEPPPLDQLLVPHDGPLSAEQVTRCAKQRADLEKIRTQITDDSTKLGRQRQFVQLLGEELATKKPSVSADTQQAVSDLERAYTLARRKLNDGIDAYNSIVKRHQGAYEMYNKTCSGRLVTKDIEDAVRQEGISPDLRPGGPIIRRPELTAEQKKEIDTYQNSLSARIETEQMRKEVGAHRKRNTVGKGSTSMQVNLTISPTGQVTARSIRVSSGDPGLDAIVLAAVDRAQPFPPPPKALASTPIVWRLGFLGSLRK
jgi:TonB family protein